MRRNGELPAQLGPSFSVQDARRAGVSIGRLRARDLRSPFRGVRAREVVAADPPADPYLRRRDEAIQLASHYARRMRAGEFFSHQTAALIWGAPLPLSGDAALHVTTFRGDAAPRSIGVHGHRVDPARAIVTEHLGFRVTSPASTWVMLGRLSLFDLVAVGDYFARVWREDGYFRVNGGLPPLATRDELAAALDGGRRVGIRSLRQALSLIRTDAWSHAETCTRLTITQAGLPEPVLNRDQYDAYGVHLGCIDLAYPEFKVAIEYQGQHHSGQHSADIERVERLRAHGWIVIQVTSSLLYNNPAELARRVRCALVERGWRPEELRRG